MSLTGAYTSQRASNIIIVGAKNQPMLEISEEGTIKICGELINNAELETELKKVFLSGPSQSHIQKTFAIYAFGYGSDIMEIASRKLKK